MAWSKKKYKTNLERKQIDKFDLKVQNIIIWW